MQPTQPTAPTPPKTPTPPSTTSFNKLTKRANQTARVVGLLVAILLIGSLVGYLIAQVVKNDSAKTPAPQVKTLTPDELSKLSAIGSNLGTSNQLLTIGATAQFNNDVIVVKDLSINGKLNANGPVSLSSLIVSGGNTSINGLVVGGDLKVTGATTLQAGATVGQLLNVVGDLKVSGAISSNTLNTTTLNVKTINVSGAIVISHLQSSGGLPNSSSGGAVGGGGTSSISGNDTAGTISINIGSGAGSGTLISVTFRTAYTANVHVLISPLSGASATAPVYVTRTATGFTLRTDATIPTGSLSYDYLVVQ